LELGEGLVLPGKPSPKPSQANLTPESESSDGGEGFSEDKGKQEIVADISHEALGMSIEQALSVWTREGKPVIHLGPGENCLDLEKLLSHRHVHERHLAAVKDWLVKKIGETDDGV